MLIDALIGGIGGAVSRTAVAPIELNRIQRQNYFIPNATLTDVYKKEGLRFKMQFLWRLRRTTMGSTIQALCCHSSHLSS